MANAAKTTKSTAFSDEEKAAMKERAREQKAAAAGAGGGSRCARQDRRDVGVGSRHGRAAPRGHQGQPRRTSTPRTWYGQPAYAKDGKVVCFFQAAQKFKTRYATFGFSDEARLDDGDHVADLLRPDGAHRRRRGEDRRPREAGRSLRRPSGPLARTLQVS